MKIRALGLMLVGAATLSGCKTTATGRKQFAAMPDSEMNVMGADAFEQIKKETPEETNPAVVNYVRCVANAVARQAKDPTGVGNWEVRVFKDDTPNAFALPGGKIGVHTGILPIANTPGQLAAVLGHEVSHVTSRHGNERVSQAFALQGGLAVASKALGGGGEAHDIAMGALGLGAQYGVLMPYGRSQESEADVLGLDLMAKAGFNPEEAIKLWENMSKASGGSPPEFLSTHPSHSTRISNLKAHMAKAKATFQSAKASPKCTPP